MSRLDFVQRVLDALELSPAVVRTCTWDVVAWNRAASVVLADYAALPVEQRAPGLPMNSMQGIHFSQSCLAGTE